MVRRVGIIGLGKMGQPMGRHLQKAGFDVTAYDIDALACGAALQTQIDRFPMPWAEKDMRIVLSEADHLRLSVPLCGVVTEVVKSVKIERGWPTPAQRET
jgi:3-hydroxyisobutyrate dehydrogenase-like beta-hydroxyacid dehydrogenase